METVPVWNLMGTAWELMETTGTINGKVPNSSTSFIFWHLMLALLKAHGLSVLLSLCAPDQKHTVGHPVLPEEAHRALADWHSQRTAFDGLG